MALLASPDVGVRRRALVSTVRPVRMRWQFSQALRRVTCIGVVALSVSLAGYTVWSWRQALEMPAETEPVLSRDNKLPTLDAHGAVGVREIAKAELLTLMSKNRPLSRTEKAQVDRGCPGLTCLYQDLGVTRWPEAASGTRAYLRLENALSRSCPEDRENFVFIKQAWWTSSKPPIPNSKTGEVPLNSVTRMKPGWYTFNYAVYFPTTKTYAWINHREYGFPANLIWPMKAYLSLSPPPLDDNRPAQLYCSTCR